ncbi:DUF4823 domain-containing protein [Piscirickettsia litoralis]|uniref:DUF4823 domain-containing protein n=1 Tax=Piscirickettsia litoralis TaxID=1891921 RepID=A0ABX3A9E0_9GAMM|nr:DUF4823 domain-containing protein [Piscirickettsia litoralis]
MYQFTALLLFISLIVGCVSHYNYYTPRPNDRDSCGLLADNESVYIGTAENFHLGDKYYTGSGDQISQLLLEEINKYVIHIKRSKHNVTLQQGLTQAHSEGYAIYIYPQIIRWQRPMGTMSWLVDHTEVRLSLYNVKHGKLVSDIIVRAGQPVASQWFEKSSQRLQLAFSRIVSRWYTCTKNQLEPTAPGLDATDS